MSLGLGIITRPGLLTESLNMCLHLAAIKRCLLLLNHLSCISSCCSILWGWHISILCSTNLCHKYKLCWDHVPKGPQVLHTWPLRCMHAQPLELESAAA